MTGQEVMAFLQSIGTTITYAKGINALGKNTEINEKVFPLLEKIISMEKDANAMTAFIRKLEEENESYRKKLMEFENWAETEKNHETVDVIPDIHVHIHKGLDDKARQTANWYCTNCWNDRIKSILHLKNKNAYVIIYFCPKCKNEFSHAISREPSNPPKANGWSM